MTDQAGTRPAVNPWIVAIAVMASTFMVVLDSTVVNVSLPHIAGDLSATVDEATWTLTAYLAANAVILPMTGWLASLFGRKRLLLLSTGGFTLTSLLCGLAPTMPVLVVLRILQGITGGTLQPISQAVLLEAFPPAERGKAMSFWGLGVVVAPILGPVLGGWLTDNYSWRWVFYINIPVGIAALALTKAYITDPPYLKRGTGGIDYRGLSLLAIGIAALQIVLDKGQEEDWFASGLIVVLTVMAVVAMVAFIWNEMRARHPIVDLRVFRHVSYSTGTVIMALVMFVLFGSMVLLPVMLQTLMGYPAIEAGKAMAPRGIGSFLGMLFVGAVSSRVDHRKLLAVGLVGAGASMFWLGAITLDAGFWDLFWPQFLQGLALSLLFVPLTTLTMDAIAPEEMGNATSLYNLVRNVGGSFGIATATTLLSRYGQVNLDRLATHVTPYSPAATGMLHDLTGAFVSRGSDLVTAQQQAMAALYGMTARQASAITFLQVFRVLGILCLVLLPLVLVLKKPRHLGSGTVHVVAE
ncbi:MAG: DHA2 family efflux MFS transporter permease subunit [Vicinamibacterales bacterium]